MGYWRNGPLFDRLSILSIATVHLMPTLIRFFIDVEITGGHTQFWGEWIWLKSKHFKLTGPCRQVQL